LVEYNVALVGEERERRVAAASTPGAIGDELDVDGIRCKVIAHLWRVGEPETLLCRRLTTAAEDEPVVRERGWWVAPLALKPGCRGGLTPNDPASHD